MPMQLSKQQKMLAAGGAVVIALALYARSRAGASGTTGATQGTYDSTAGDAAKYADTGDQALKDQLDKAQQQINAQGQRLAWAGSQLHRQGVDITQLRGKLTTPPKVTNPPHNKGGKVKNEPVWAGAKLPLRK